ncbi:hypothetical protein M8C21_006432 [Ambrosia artemisiifolia]|uniref:Uncharacterized protein n=1 Tax=Ambrosia artemisiifolia TaxID=4212 RepID=A0AAD5CQH0_AMBAR|nr:hypothetical protein M8C21_006432 [Ambrosia artemisiifolia]
MNSVTSIEFEPAHPSTRLYSMPQPTTHLSPGEPSPDREEMRRGDKGFPYFVFHMDKLLVKRIELYVVFLLLAFCRTRIVHAWNEPRA